MKANHRRSKRGSALQKLGASFLLTGVFLVGAIALPQPASAATELTMMSPQLNDTEIQRKELQTQAERKQDQIENILPKVEQTQKEQEAVAAAKAELQAATTQLEKEIAELKVKVAEKKAREAREATEAANRAAEATRAAEAARKVAPPRAAPTRAAGKYDSSNTYSYGYCTWYVKNRRGSTLPNGLGNANTWYSRARAMGMATGSAPAVGAVGTTTRGSLGHVVYVERVNGNGTIYISEMNYAGWGKVSYRTVSASEFVYIY